jgi:hypothetical protein
VCWGLELGFGGLEFGGKCLRAWLEIKGWEGEHLEGIGRAVQSLVHEE